MRRFVSAIKNSSSKKIIRKYGRLLLIIAIPLIAGILAIPRIAEHAAFWGERDELDEYQKWKRRKIALPPDAMDVKPFAPDTVKAAKTFYVEWKKKEVRAKEILDAYVGKNGLLNSLWGRSPSDVLAAAAAKGVDFDKVDQGLAEMKPLIDAFRSLVRRPDYEINVVMNDLAGVDENYSMPSPDFYSLQTGAKLLRLQALSQIYHGKANEALETSELIVRAGMCSPYDGVLDQLISIAISLSGTRTWYAAVSACDNPVLLAKALDLQNRLWRRQGWFSKSVPSDGVSHIEKSSSSVKFSQDFILIRNLEYLGILRMVKRRGVRVDLPKKLTSARLFGYMWLAIANYEERYYLHNAKNLTPAPQIQEAIYRNRSVAYAYGCEDEQLRTWLRASISIDGPSTHFNLAFPPKSRFRNKMIEPFISRNILHPNESEVFARVRHSLARFDILRLETAAKLYVLKRGHSPTKLEEIESQYLKEELHDRFDGKNADYRRNSGGYYYSVGPDGVDQKCNLRYDPTNGTFSSGDIFY